MASLEDRLGYAFRRSALLQTALTHRAVLNLVPAGDRMESNERLEFLGDAVLDLIVAQKLIEALPGADEGRLSRFRAGTVNEGQLARAARAVSLGAYLRLDRGEEQSGGREKDSILADALEAVVGAIYLDGGLEAVRCACDRLLDPIFQEVLAQEQVLDPKTEFQEWMQRTVHLTPLYRMVRERGPDHDKRFEVEVIVGEEVRGQGEGRTKKEAEQAAARRALEILGHLRGTS